MINRLRVILPPDSVVVAIFLIFGLAEGPFVFLEWNLQQQLDVPRPGLFLVRLVATFYGVWRFCGFHPGFNTEYRIWLERTPWNRSMPLPAGPIRLTWEDSLPLCGLAIMGAFLGPYIPYEALNLFLIGYLSSFILSSFATETKPFGYAVAFGVGLAIRFWPDLRVSLGILVATFLIAMIGLRQALGKFPWLTLSDQARLIEVQKSSENACGWPFDQLKPTLEVKKKSSKADGLMFGLLAGWFLFAAESLFKNRSDQLVLVHLVTIGGIGLLAVLRTFIYTVGYAPPISLLGRIRTFRWIIPGYDKIFLAPVCTILVGVLAIDRFRPRGLDDLIVLPIALAMAITITLDTGPSLRAWQLTGKHRITVNVAKAGGEFVKVG